jgi:hypothetical protein
MRWVTAISGVLVFGRLPMVSNGPTPMLTMTVANRSRRLGHAQVRKAVGGCHRS